MERSDSVWAAFAASAAICLVVLCLFSGGTEFSADVENIGGNGTISAFAENSDALVSQGETRFDDSLWGQLARAMEEGLSDFYG